MNDASMCGAAEEVAVEVDSCFEPARLDLCAVANAPWSGEAGYFCAGDGGYHYNCQYHMWDPDFYNSLGFGSEPECTDYNTC